MASTHLLTAASMVIPLPEGPVELTSYLTLPPHTDADAGGLVFPEKFNTAKWAEIELLKARKEADEARKAAELAKAESARAQAAAKTMSALPQAIRLQLSKILGMLGSLHDGEVVNAARQAERLRQKFKIQWSEIV
jgi:hypothetical protein